MSARRTIAALVLAGGSVAAVLWRRAGQGRRDHVDVYFEDGSMVSFAEGSPEAARLLPLAAEVLAAARG
jgi:hypothetical protein